MTTLPPGLGRTPAADPLAEAARLTAWLSDSARDDPAEQAAIALVALRTGWLRHPEFIAACVCTAQAGHRTVTWIDWTAAVRFIDRGGPDDTCVRVDIGAEAATTRPVSVLLLAAELAGARTGRNPGDLLGGLDPDTGRVAIECIREAAGEVGS
jgi:hypothetical protein